MNLKSAFGKSTAWMSLAATGTSVVSFSVFVVLSRLLTPEDIGLVAFALIVVELGGVIIYGGYSQAIIQKLKWDNEFSSTCFYLNFSFSIVASLFVFFIVAPIAGIYFNAKAAPILQVFSLFLLLEGIKAVHEGKLKREFQFKALALRAILSSLIPGAIGIYFAIRGYGAWALVIQQGLNLLTNTVLTILAAKWMPSLTFSKAFAKDILQFSWPLMSGQLISNLGAKLFELLIGIFIGPAALGFYRVAGRALYIVQEIVIKPFEHTALSLFSRMDGRAEQAAAVLRIANVSGFFVMPIFWGIAAIAPQFIKLAFGESWALSGHLMMILAIGITPSMIGVLVNAVLTANKQSRMVMNISTMSFLINCGLAFASVPFGLEWATIGFALRSIVISCLSLYWLQSTLGIAMLKIPKLLAPSCTGAFTMFIAIQGISPIINAHLSLISSIVFLCSLGALVYTVLMLVAFRSSTHAILLEVLDAAPSKLKPYLLALKRFTD